MLAGFAGARVRPVRPVPVISTLPRLAAAGGGARRKLPVCLRVIAPQTAFPQDSIDSFRC